MSEESGVRSQERSEKALVEAGSPYSLLLTPHSRNGFTLIELTIVIVILGVMLTLIVPRLGDLGEANLKHSSRHLTGMIRFLRDESLAKKIALRLRFDVKEQRYWAEYPALLDDKTVEFKRYSTSISSEATLEGRTTFRDVQVASHPDDTFMQFTPDGWVEPAFIHLRDADEKDFTLLVNPLLGSTELREGYVEEK
jgi:prepilin-type N-terminal cleavage/methylation domain-containing protein